MMENLPMAVPQCRAHNHTQDMALRALMHQTREQKYCGVWYDCPRCTSSVLFQSRQLQAQSAAQRAILETAP